MTLTFSRVRLERMLRRLQRLNEQESTGLVVKDGARTWGNVQWAPMEAYAGSMGSVGAVLDVDATVDVANGILPGLSATDGIDDEIWVDHDGDLRKCKIVGIGTPPDEPGGDLLRLTLKLRE